MKTKTISSQQLKELLNKATRKDMIILRKSGIITINGQDFKTKV